MDGIENKFINLCLNKSSSSSSASVVTTICSHQRLKRRVTTEEATGFRNEVYQCEQCHEQCLVTFGISSSSHPSSSAADESSSSVSESSKTSHSIEFENTSNRHSEGKSNEEEETLDTIPSRLKKDFVCVDNKVLGKGHFGQVAKFRNKKDEKIYAIKKITKVTKRKEREVKVLSTLQHENIVRYYNCWTEPNDSAFPKENEDEEESVEDSDNEEEEPMNEDILYIQMEFCEKGTLREAIDSGEFIRNRFRMWTIFRQIVEGIKHFHSKDVIHRDLKPENVFLNSDDRVKIGDFGLATANLRPNLDQAAQTSSSHDEHNSNHSMGNCGTHLYKAPELVTGKYDKKSDMYSLGILFLEMCRGPYKTEMERRTELTEFRTENYVIPPDIRFISLEQEYFVETYFSKEGSTKLTNNMVKILEKLLIHDPEQRFSADELLRSSFMHPPLLDGIPEFFQLADFIIASTGKDSKYQEYYALMRRILSENTSEADIFKWLDKEKFGQFHSDIKSDFLNALEYPSFHEIFIKRCQEIGAQYLQPATLFPKLSTVEDYKVDELKQLATLLANKSSRSFIDEHGTLALLPGDSYTIFARHVASYNIITELKRYCVSHVYNGLVTIGTPPEPSTELAFDIVSSSSAEPSELRKADAEVVQVIGNVLKDCGLPSVVIKLSHYSLLQAILTYCNIPSGGQRLNMCRKAKEELRNVQFNRPRGFNANLDAQMKSLLSLLIVHGSLDDIKSTLINLPDWVGSEAASMADKAFTDLEEILRNIIGDDQEGYPVYIDLSVGLDNYENILGFNGFIFNFVYQEYQDQYPSLTNTFSYIVLAAGGRYDALVASFRDAIASPDNHFNHKYDEFNRPTSQFYRKEERSCKQFVVGGAIYMNNLIKKDVTKFEPNRPLTIEEFTQGRRNFFLDQGLVPA